jgi:ribonuclease HII
MVMILGIDEAGRGPVIGPLVLAGVMIDEKKEVELRSLGVKDSKLLSPRQREILFEKIIAIVDKYDIRIIQPDEIDSAVNDATYNLNWLEADHAAKIINALNPDTAYLDCPSTNIEAFSSYVRKKLKNQKTAIISEHKADERYPVVSAASILAKVTRDSEINKLRKKYGHFGSGYPADPYTKNFIQHNYNLPIFRKSWATWKNAAGKKNQSNLSEF